MNPFSQYQQDAAVITALLHRNERPPTDPMFSPEGASYYRTWRAAVYCWHKDPSRRPPMEEVVRMLKPPQNIPATIVTSQAPVTETPEEVCAHADGHLPDSSPHSIRRPPIDLDTFGGGKAGSDRELEPEDDDEEKDDGNGYCYCAGDPDENMIQCENASGCLLEWVS